MSTKNDAKYLMVDDYDAVVSNLRRVVVNSEDVHAEESLNLLLGHIRWLEHKLESRSVDRDQYGDTIDKLKNTLRGVREGVESLDVAPQQHFIVSTIKSVVSEAV